MFRKNLYKLMDKILLADVIALSVIGIIAVSSGGSMRYAIMQTIWLLIGLIAIYFITRINYNLIEKYYLYIYIICIGLLLITLFIGRSANGAQRWISIGSLNLQFSEFAKVGIIIVLAKLLNKQENEINNIWYFLKVLLVTGIPFLLVVKQNDTGTALVFIGILIGMLFISGIKLRYILGMILPSAMAAPLLYKYVLHGYQKKRILSFINPNYDLKGAGYQVYQSKIAIGSGRLFGYGLYHGITIQGHYIPEDYTDFIFSVIGQELGFLGAVILLLLFFILLYRLIMIATISKDKFGTLIVGGIASMLLMHIFENIGMTIGVTPMAGIPLPFISYGGSSLLANLMAIGLALNIGMRKTKIVF